jgi:hypothetical protein
MLLGELIHNNHSFGSLGLNLAYEGLLLGVQRGDRRETPTKLQLAQPNLLLEQYIPALVLQGRAASPNSANIATTFTSGVHFAGSDRVA